MHPCSDLDSILDELDKARAAGVRVADEADGKRLLAAAGIAVPAGRTATDAAQAVTVARSLGMPVGVKIARVDLPHKSDVGGVRGPLDHDAQVADAAQALLGLSVEGERRLLVERWHTGGAGCFLGLSFDSEFGPLIAFGVGGIWVEMMRDVSYRMAPVDPRQAAAMIDQLRAATMLHGGRGQPPVDLNTLAATISEFSMLAAHPRAHEVLREIEINPLLAAYRGPMLALDCTAVLRTADDEPTT